MESLYRTGTGLETSENLTNRDYNKSYFEGIGSNVYVFSWFFTNEGQVLWKGYSLGDFICQLKELFEFSVF